MPRKHFIVLYLFINGPTRRMHITKAFQDHFGTSCNHAFWKVDEHQLWERDLDKSKVVTRTESWLSDDGIPQVLVKCSGGMSYYTNAKRNYTKSVWKLTKKGMDLVRSIMKKEFEEYQERALWMTESKWAHHITDCPSIR